MKYTLEQLIKKCGSEFGGLNYLTLDNSPVRPVGWHAWSEGGETHVRGAKTPLEAVTKLAYALGKI